MRAFFLVPILLLAGCGSDTASAPPPEAKPESQDTQLRDAVKAPLDKAHAVEQVLQDSADATDKALQDAGG
jgi:hypothetical protein